MRASLALLVAYAASGCTSAVPAPSASAPAPATSASAPALELEQEQGPIPVARRVSTMSELMVDIIYPASDAVFYITTRTPTNSEEWAVLAAQTLMVAESANLLMMPGRARDQDRWMRNAELMLLAGEAAYRATKDRDVAALEALSDQLYQSCVTCHRNYRRGYGRRR